MRFPSLVIPDHAVLPYSQFTNHLTGRRDMSATAKTIHFPSEPRVSTVDAVEWAELTSLVEEMLDHGWTAKQVGRQMGYAGDGTGVYPFLYGYNLPEKEKRERLRNLVERKRAGKPLGGRVAPTQRSRKLAEKGIRRNRKRRTTNGNGKAKPHTNGAEKPKVPNFVEMSYVEAERHLDEASALLNGLLQIQTGATTLAQRVGGATIDFGDSVEPAIEHIKHALEVLRN